MAHELWIRNGGGLVKIRNPWAVALLPFVTFGIYHLVWWYRINRELRDFGYANNAELGDSPALSTLALFPGGLIIVPALVSYWRGTRRVQLADARQRDHAAQRMDRGAPIHLHPARVLGLPSGLPEQGLAVRLGYLSIPRAAAVQAVVTSRIHLACVVASDETHSTSLLPGPRSSEAAIAFSAFS